MAFLETSDEVGKGKEIVKKAGGLIDDGSPLRQRAGKPAQREEG